MEEHKSGSDVTWWPDVNLVDSTAAGSDDDMMIVPPGRYGFCQASTCKWSESTATTGEPTACGCDEPHHIRPHQQCISLL